MMMRAKMERDEEWYYLNPNETFQSQQVKCNGEDDLCVYFSVGFLPEIEYEVYDVAIEMDFEDSDME